MTTLRKSLADYLELRRGMGFKLRYYERRLGRFLSFVEERGAKKITTKLAIQFATHDSDLNRIAFKTERVGDSSSHDSPKQVAERPIVIK